MAVRSLLLTEEEQMEHEALELQEAQLCAFEERERLRKLVEDFQALKPPYNLLRSELVSVGVDIRSQPCQVREPTGLYHLYIEHCMPPRTEWPTSWPKEWNRAGYLACILSGGVSGVDARRGRHWYGGDGRKSPRTGEYLQPLISWKCKEGQEPGAKGYAWAVEQHSLELYPELHDVMNGEAGQWASESEERREAMLREFGEEQRRVDEINRQRLESAMARGQCAKLKTLFLLTNPLSSSRQFNPSREEMTNHLTEAEARAYVAKQLERHQQARSRLIELGELCSHGVPRWRNCRMKCFEFISGNTWRRQAIELRWASHEALCSWLSDREAELEYCEKVRHEAQ